MALLSTLAYKSSNADSTSAPATNMEEKKKKMSSGDMLASAIIEIQKEKDCSLDEAAQSFAQLWVKAYLDSFKDD